MAVLGHAGAIASILSFLGMGIRRRARRRPPRSLTKAIEQLDAVRRFCECTNSTLAADLPNALHLIIAHLEYEEWRKMAADQSLPPDKRLAALRNLRAPALPVWRKNINEMDQRIDRPSLVRDALATVERIAGDEKESYQVKDAARAAAEQMRENLVGY